MTVFFGLSSIQSQTKEKELSNAEQFSNQAGTLVEKTFINIGKVKDVKVTVMKIRDLNSDVIKNGLRFEYENKGSYTSDTKIAVLDQDDIDGIVKSMNNMIVNIFNTTKTNYTEVTFKSRSGFEAGCYFSIDRGLGSNTPQTKNEKVYITTTEKMYEGKVVNHDEKGSYIWKQVAVSTDEPTGKWKAYIQIEKYISSSIVYLNTEDFKALLNLIEQARAKM